MALTDVAADYSRARPTVEELERAGYGLVVRYLSWEDAKDLQIPERDRLWSSGIYLALIWETTAQRPLGGYAAGKADAQEANRRADALGWPTWKVLAYAVDFDGRQRLAEIVDYFRGVLDGSARPVGVYGPYAVIEHLARVFGDRIQCYWQCAAWSGVGQGTGGAIYVPAYGYNVPVSAHACLFQFYGQVRIPETDHNVVLQPEIAATWFHHPNEATEPQEDDEMAQYFLWEAVDGNPFGFGAGWYLAFSHDRYVMALDPGQAAALTRLADKMRPMNPKAPPIVVQAAADLDPDVWASKILHPRHPALDVETPRARFDAEALKDVRQLIDSALAALPTPASPDPASVDGALVDAIIARLDEAFADRLIDRVIERLQRPLA